MNGITHKQTKIYMHAELDGLLTDSQRRDLDAHLRECEACRVESESLSMLTARLSSNFRARWDTQDGPSQNVLTSVLSRKGRIIMSNRIRFGLRTLAGIGALIVLGFVINFAFVYLRNPSITVSGTETTNGVIPEKQLPLLAFPSEQNGNSEIYTVKADGSNLTNLTNNPAYDGMPFWSPNGKQIAFESDRSGLPQIYLMDANGSNATQVTDNESAHLLDNFDGKTNPWSPDGSKLLFLQQNPGDGTLSLCSININGKNKISIITGNIQVNAISWSPDGKHIGFILSDSQNANETNIYIANADGGVPWAATEFLQQDEQLSDTGYTWSHDGQTIFFKTFSQKASPHWTIYEVRLNDHSVSEKYSTKSFRLNEWLDGIAVTTDPNGALNWLNTDRISGVLDPHAKCEQADAPRSGSYVQHSPGGNWAIASYCPNGDHWFYWANSDGTKTKQLLDSPISAQVNSFTDEIIWSPDDAFVAFRLRPAVSDANNDMYIFNVEKSLSNPTIQPVKIESSYSPSWQPIPNNNIVEEKPTPEPTQTSSNGGLTAFVSDQNGNSEIYTMHADGSGLTDLTNNPAHDINPFWSPDGTQIAFQSDRSGLMQIYTMNAEGSNVVQLTNNEANHELMSQNGPWSPNGKTLLFTEWGAPDVENWKLYTIGVDGQNKTLLADVPPVYAFPSWSPDGKHVAFVSDSRLYVVDSNSENLTETTKSLPPGEVMDSYNLPNYYWAPDGQSITFISSNIDSVSGKTQGGEPNVNLFHWNAYEASLDGRTLVLNATTRSPLGGWWKGGYFVTPFVGVRPWTWVGSYGVRTVDPFRNCKDLSGGGSLYTASSSGNVAIGAMCPNGDWQLYMVSPQGVMSPLMASPLPTVQGSLDHLSWSPDGKFIAFNLTSNGKTEMYLINVTEALKDPSIERVHVSKGSGTENNLPVWQPQP
jgi:Tol biopolymer transport system component